MTPTMESTTKTLYEVNVKVKLSLYLTKYHATNSYGGVKV